MKALNCLMLILLPVLSSGWEVAVGTESGLAFLDSDGNMSVMLNKNETDEIRNGQSVGALALDSTNNQIFFSISSRSSNVSVLGVSVNSSGHSTPVPVILSGRGADNINGLAYDEVGKSLFWTDREKHAIWWSDIQGDIDERRGAVLHQLKKEEIPSGIAVDGCRRLLFWTNSNHLSPSVERSNLDGTSRVVLINSELFMPLAIALDPSGKGRIFWIDDSEGIHYTIEMSNLDGTGRATVVQGQHQQPYALAFAPPIENKRQAVLFWSDWTHGAVWKLPFGDAAVDPINMHKFMDVIPTGLIAASSLGGNKTIECPIISEIIDDETTPSEIREPSPKPEVVSPVSDVSNMVRTRAMNDYCINGEPVTEGGKYSGLQCKCTPGYTGQRCEQSLCHNFCIHGSCRLDQNSEGDWEAKCSCRAGFSGRRCEYDPCGGYCLNGGRCRIEGGGQPKCTCPGSGQLILGERCERRLSLLEKMCAMRCSQGDSKTPNFVPLEAESTEENTGGLLCVCPSSPGKYAYYSFTPKGGLNATGDKDKQLESSESPFVLVLGVLCVVMFGISIYLAYRVFSLRRLPRIKKRIIVSKGSVPLAAGCGGPGRATNAGSPVIGEQQQCEITIENCCNMNICETPCFEPQIRSAGSSGGTVETGKEEKKMLLANMEMPKSSCGPCPGGDELY